MKDINRPTKILLIEDTLADAALMREALEHEQGTEFELVHADRLASGLQYLAEADKAGAQVLAGRLRRVIAERPFQAVSATVQLALATATAAYPDEGMTEEELLRLTEEELQHVEKPKPRIMVVDDEPKIRRFL